MFDESRQFVSEVLEIQDKSQHVCRIVSIRIRATCLDMCDELHQFVLQVLEIQYKFQHVCRIVSIHSILNLNKFRHVSTCSDMFENCMNHNNLYSI